MLGWPVKDQSWKACGIERMNGTFDTLDRYNLRTNLYLFNQSEQDNISIGILQKTLYWWRLAVIYDRHKANTSWFRSHIHRPIDKRVTALLARFDGVSMHGKREILSRF